MSPPTLLLMQMKKNHAVHGITGSTCPLITVVVGARIILSVTGDGVSVGNVVYCVRDHHQGNRARSQDVELVDVVDGGETLYGHGGGQIVRVAEVATETPGG